jgi:SAM-dependent methyltransferase
LPPSLRLALRRAILACRTATSRLPAVEKSPSADTGTDVDSYWGQHTVNSSPYVSVGESLRYLEWRFKEYPLFREFMDLWGRHDGEVLLDYGCGPGNDVVGFLVNTSARQVIGMDVSPRSLDLARRRLVLHRIELDRVRLIQTNDAAPSVPLADGSVDYIHCAGVLHHTSHPEALLAEFHRVLRPGGRACVMVYNRDSLWLHLGTAYVRQIIERTFAELGLEEAFRRNTDGPSCPLSRCYTGPEFLTLCRLVGFEGQYQGGYLSRDELAWRQEFAARAIRDDRLAEQHREFLTALTTDASGYPLYQGKHAGVGGVYHLRKPG